MIIRTVVGLACGTAALVSVPTARVSALRPTTALDCGVLAICESSAAPLELRATALELQAKLRHRGPDGSGIHVITPTGKDKSYVVAHERLAIVDPLSGNQPLFSFDNTLALTVNGEIYNYRELQKLLYDRRRFNTGSDCEVIVHLYQQIGCEVAQHLDGDFAFVIVDTKSGEFYAARDPIGINSLYWGRGSDGALWFASEFKALVDNCKIIEQFPPGHYYQQAKESGATASTPLPSAQCVRFWKPKWLEGPQFATRPYDPVALNDALTAAVKKRLMSDVPYGVLLSGGLDSSLVASIAARSVPDARDLRTFSVGLEGSPDLAAAAKVAAHLGTKHYTFTFTVQEGIDAIPDVIRHLETYDVTTIRAGTALYLLSRKIKALGVKMVLSGEGADEAYAGYLYFHKAPNANELHLECVRKINNLHMYDCLRANKATMAFGLEVRVPFLDEEFLDVAMELDPEYKLTKKQVPPPPTGTEGHAQFQEKWAIRKAFADGTYLPDEVLWRQKEQFSDGVGYSWIDGIKDHAAATVSDDQLANAAQKYKYNTPNTKEGYMVREIFTRVFGDHDSAAETVPGGPSIACSTAAAIAWDASWSDAKYHDPSGRAVGSHDDGYFADEPAAKVEAKVEA